MTNRFIRFGKRVKRIYQNGLIAERRHDRFVANNVLAVRDEISAKAYFTAQKRVNKLARARQKRRDKNSKK
jgi:hypothetical protein